jgi:hypothetical protein
MTLQKWSKDGNIIFEVRYEKDSLRAIQGKKVKQSLKFVPFTFRNFPIGFICFNIKNHKITHKHIKQLSNFLKSCKKKLKKIKKKLKKRNKHCIFVPLIHF